MMMRGKFLSQLRLLMMAIFCMAWLGNQAIAADGAADGAKIFKRCKACHTLEGKNKIGPYVNGVVGREAAAVKGFKYSRAMKDSGLVWTEENLDKYLANPRKFIPKNKMAFAGLRKEEERKAVIDYMAGFE